MQRKALGRDPELLVILCALRVFVVKILFEKARSSVFVVQRCKVGEMEIVGDLGDKRFRAVPKGLAAIQKNISSSREIRLISFFQTLCAMCPLWLSIKHFYEPDRFIVV